MESMKEKMPLLFLVLFLIVAVGLAFLFLRSPSSTELSQEGLGHFVALVSSPNATWHSIKDLSTAEPVSVLSEFDGRVVDYAVTDAGEALIYDDKGIHVVQTRTDNSDSWYVISRSPNEKRDISLSRDGNYVAYAELINSNTPTDLSSWEVYFFDRTTGDLFSGGVGHRPHFLTFASEDGRLWEVLTFTSSDSIVTVPTVAREEDGLVVQNHEIYFPANIDEIVYFSSGNVPGETIAVAFNSLLKTYDVFNVPSSYFDLEFLGSVDADNILDVSGGSLLVTQRREIHVYPEPGADISEYVREVDINDSERIVEIIKSEYE